MSSNTEDEDPPTQRPSAPISDDEFWLVSYAEDDDRELTTKEIVAAMKRGEITLSTLIWRDGMGEWQTIASIDELRSRAGFIVQPFLTDAPPRPAGESLRAIAALSEDIEELPSSAIQSAPPSSLAEADFLGSDDGDSSLAPPRIDHAAFFKSSPPPDVAENPAALPALPSLGGKTVVAGTPTAVASAKPTVKSKGSGGLKWVLVLCTIVGAAVAGFFLTPAKEDAAPPQPVAKPVEVAAATVTPTPDTPPDSPAAGAAPSAAADIGQQVAAAPTATAPTLQPSQALTAKQAMPGSTPAATPATVPASPVAVAPATVTEPKPASTPAPPRVTSTAPFDKSAASAALSQAAAQASSCRQQGDPSGTAQVEVTFSPSGRATRAIIGGPPFRGTATGSCIAQAMRSAQVPPFAGDLVTVQKRVVIQ
ncbi:MAG TPA: GYF domain-containing protein [Polyangiaceae bacterium]|nr:GYF domain-containing protein [Polyangiaceae bacterium]